MIGASRLSIHKHKPSFDDACRLFVVRKWVRVDDKFCIDITRTTDAPGLEFEGVRLRLNGGYWNECLIES